MQRSSIKPRRVTRRSERSEFTSDSLWRGGVMDAGGWRCASCGDMQMTLLEADHIIPRAQGGLSDLVNGLILCSQCHARKTASTLQIDPRWLRLEQIDYLAETGWCVWDTETGEPSGRGWRHFLSRRVRGLSQPTQAGNAGA